MCTVSVCEATRNPDNWYTLAQAAAGPKAYKKTCGSCHGGTLQGGMGPALVASHFRKHMEAKRSRLCGRAYTHRCADDGAGLGNGDELRKHHGLSACKKTEYQPVPRHLTIGWICRKLCPRNSAATVPVTVDFDTVSTIGS
jgi:hypothetical protein